MLFLEILVLVIPRILSSHILFSVIVVHCAWEADLNYVDNVKNKGKSFDFVKCACAQALVFACYMSHVA